MMRSHNQNIDHSTLIRFLKDSQEQALCQLFDLYSDKIYSLSYRVLKDQYESEDLVQEVFVKLWETRFKLDDTGNIWSYLYVIAKRLALNKLRDKHLMRKGSILAEDCHLANADRSDEKMLIKEMIMLEHLVLENLPAQQKMAYLLSRTEGLTHKEIADRMNVAPNTVKNHMVQALKTFRKYFQKFGYPTYLFFLFFH